MPDQFSNLMELLRHQDNINAFNMAAPNHSCGNRECEAECGKVVKIAKNLGVDPVPMVQSAIEKTLASKFGCKRKTEAFSNIGKPIPGCKFGYTYGSHPDATDAQIAAGKTGGKSHTITDTQTPDVSNGTHVASANIKETQLGKEAPPSTKKAATGNNSEDSFDEAGKEIYNGSYEIKGKKIAYDFTSEFNKDYSDSKSSLYDSINIERKNVDEATKEHIAHKEGNVQSVYSDTKGNLTIGIGLNLRVPENRKTLEGILGRKLTDKENAVLSKEYASPEAAKTALEKAKINIKITPEQANEILEKTYPSYANKAKEIMEKGKWVEKTEIEDGKEVVKKYYDPSVPNPEGWNSLPPVAKAACIEMHFNGALAEYEKFRKALKKGDYKRAAYEVLASKDFVDGQEGQKKRRRDLAKDIMRIQEEE